jgi:hypothetical protein
VTDMDARAPWAPPETLVLHCPHCGNTAPQRLALYHRYEDSEVYVNGTRSGETLTCSYQARICSTCDDLVLYYDNEFSEEPEVVHPVGHSLHYAVPGIVRECYEEASKVRVISPSAYAVLLRRALEAICDDRQVAKGNLQKRLGELAKKGEILQCSQMRPLFCVRWGTTALI